MEVNPNSNVARRRETVNRSRVIVTEPESPMLMVTVVTGSPLSISSGVPFARCCGTMLRDKLMVNVVDG